MDPISERAAVLAGRECGSCALCCKLPQIDWLKPPKPAGQWCTHCRPGAGCGIWAQRPQECAAFFCDWRLDAALGEAWRPDRCGFIVTKKPGITELLVDPARPGCWRKPPYAAVLREAAAREMAQGEIILIVMGARRFILLPDTELPLPPALYGADIRLYHDAEGQWAVRGA